MQNDDTQPDERAATNPTTFPKANIEAANDNISRVQDTVSVRENILSSSMGSESDFGDSFHQPNCFPQLNLN